MSNRSRKICFWRIELGRRVWLTTLPPTVSRLSGQYEILNINNIALLFFTFYKKCNIFVFSQPLPLYFQFWISIFVSLYKFHKAGGRRGDEQGLPLSNLTNIASADPELWDGKKFRVSSIMLQHPVDTVFCILIPSTCSFGWRSLFLFYCKYLHYMLRSDWSSSGVQICFTL
jgi:hypothetical protein